MKQLLTDLEFMYWCIRYGFILFSCNFELWGMILGSNYGEFYPCNHESAESACLAYFWEGLSDGIDGWRD